MQVSNQHVAATRRATLVAHHLAKVERQREACARACSGLGQLRRQPAHALLLPSPASPSTLMLMLVEEMQL